MHESTWDNTPDATKWQNVVAILQSEFRNGTLSKEITHQTVVLITKGARGYFRGIDLVRVIWKAFTNLLNCLLTAVIKFHNMLHSF